MSIIILKKSGCFAGPVAWLNRSDAALLNYQYIIIIIPVEIPQLYSRMLCLAYQHVGIVHF